MDRPVSYGLVHEFGCDGAVYTTTDSSNYTTFGTADLADSGNFFTNELLLETSVSCKQSLWGIGDTHHRPILLRPRDVENKFANDLSAPL